MRGMLLDSLATCQHACLRGACWPQVTCEFCQEQYQFYEKDLQDVLTVV